MDYRSLDRTSSRGREHASGMKAGKRTNMKCSTNHWAAAVNPTERRLFFVVDDKRCCGGSHILKRTLLRLLVTQVACNVPSKHLSSFSFLFFSHILAGLVFKYTPILQPELWGSIALSPAPSFFFSFFSFSFLHVDGPPAVDAEDAAGDDVVQVGPRRGGPGAVDLRGGVVEALVGLRLLAAYPGGGGGRQVDVAVLGLVHLGFVGEQDLGL